MKQQVRKIPRGNGKNPVTGTEPQIAKVSQEQFNLLNKAQVMLERAVRDVLCRLGCEVTDNMKVDDIYTRAKLLDISFKHYTFEGRDEMNGFYFKKLGKWQAVIYDPKFDNGKIIIQKKEIRDVPLGLKEQ
jgi:hypothetical protein